MIDTSRPNRTRRWVAFPLVAMAAAAVVAAGFLPARAAPPEPSPTTVLATVNGEAITVGDVNARFEQVVGPEARNMPAEKVSQLRERLRLRILESLVTERILDRAVDQEKIAVTDEDMATYLEKVKENLPEGMTLESYLERSGESLDGFKALIQKQLRLKKLFDKPLAQVTRPTAEEVKAYYDEHPKAFERPESIQARHVLLQVARDADEKARAAKKSEAEALQARLAEKGGENFAKIAGASSDCPSKKRGGDLGWFSRGDMAKAFEDAAFALEKGAISPVVETPYGYHVIQVTDRRPAGQVSLDEVKERISNYLYEMRQDEAAADYVKTLKDKAEVVYKSESGE